MSSIQSDRGASRGLAALALILALGILTASPGLEGGETNDTFTRGDANRDALLDIGDAIATLDFLFGGAGTTLPCEDAADANDDGAIDIGDAVSILNLLFASAAPLPPPFGAPGSDPTADGLGCSTVDCLQPPEVLAALGVAPGTTVWAGAIAFEQATAGSVSIETGPADLTMTIDTVDYTAGSHGFALAGESLTQVPITAVVVGIPMSCQLGVQLEWSLSGSLGGPAFTTDSIRLLGVDSVNTIPYTVSSTGCSVLDATIGAFLADYLQFLTEFHNDLLWAVLGEMEIALGSELVIACD